MPHPDRMVKLLLAAVVVLLTIIALRPASLGSQANAASGTDNSVQNVATTGYFTMQISSIRKDGIIGVYVLDSAQAFILQYKGGVEVYRVDNHLPPVIPTPTAK